MLWKVFQAADLLLAAACIIMQLVFDCFSNSVLLYAVAVFGAAYLLLVPRIIQKQGHSDYARAQIIKKNLTLVMSGLIFIVCYAIIRIFWADTDIEVYFLIPALLLFGFVVIRILKSIWRIKVEEGKRML